jgi:3'(2'), 5'-bisphosphate nucleotidase
VSLFSDPYQGWLNRLCALCEEAGAAIVSHYHSDDASSHRSKADNSPLTNADLASHDILLRGLEQFGLPVLSEESPPEAFSARRDWSEFWMVDPLDGTKEFIERTGEFTINIALIRQHRACFGLVAVPLRGQVYAGEPGRAAARYQHGQWQAIQCRSLQPPAPLVVLTSRRHRGERLDACLEDVARCGSEVRRDYVGSALKFCQLAAGEADFYPRFSPCSEWDTAAGQALLEGAGGCLHDLEGAPLRYNEREGLLNPDFLAVADSKIFRYVQGVKGV